MQDFIQPLIDGGVGIFALAGFIYVVVQQQKTIRDLGTIIGENTVVTRLLKDSIERLLKDKE